MTLFFCGVIMSHYSYHNISSEAKVGSVISLSTIAFIAEAFLYTYQGISLFATESSSFSLGFAFLVIIAAMLSRFGSIFISIAIFAFFKKCQLEIDLKQLTLLFFSGMIRGAIAFALSLEIKSEIAPHRDQMISTTLMMVLMTTIVLGGIMSAFAKLIGLEKEGEDDDLGTHESRIDKLADIVFPKTKKKSWIQLKLNWLDDKILKPLFGGDLSKLEKHKEERRIDQERRSKKKNKLHKVKINREGNFNKHSNDKYHTGGDFLSPKDSDSHSKDRSISPKRSIKLASISEEKEDN